MSLPERSVSDERVCNQQGDGQGAIGIRWSLPFGQQDAKFRSTGFLVDIDGLDDWTSPPSPLQKKNEQIVEIYEAGPKLITDDSGLHFFFGGGEG